MTENEKGMKNSIKSKEKVRRELGERKMAKEIWQTYKMGPYHTTIYDFFYCWSELFWAYLEPLFIIKQLKFSRFSEMKIQFPVCEYS